MRYSLALGAMLPLALACDNVDNDACASAMKVAAASATSFCATYTASINTARTGLPTWASACAMKPKHISSACSCVVGGGAGATSVVSSPTTLATVVASSTPAVVSSSVVVASSSAVANTTAAISSSVIVASSSAVANTTAAVTSAAQVATAATVAATTAVGNGGTTCTITAYADIASAVASCTNILLSGVSAPASSTIDLSALQTGATVIFAGETTFGYTEDSDFDPIVISGTDITITGQDGHVIDGNGPAYWDGQGSNGGSDKPDHFIVAKDVINGVFSNLNIQNWPVHCFDVSGGDTITFSNIFLNNTAGDAANSASDGDAAAHNSDGFDFSSSSNILLTDSTVYNQDDCVAITSGSNITVNNMYCSGGHGLSIGSIGGKSNNTVEDITFQNSVVVNSDNGCRIKSNADTTGSITNIAYKNITLSGISDYGIDVQQDYLNGGATGEPTNGVTISTVSFTDVTGTMSDGNDYYILCGDGSCSGFTFTNVAISGGSGDSCNYPSTGCPA